MTSAPFTEPIARHIWENRYRAQDETGAVERGIEETWSRVAGALAEAEPSDAAHWRARFREILRDFRFLPGGRILAGAGVARDMTLFNCFVTDRIEDSMEGIFTALRESAVTMQQGGGIGCDFSTLRPRGMPARDTGTIASGAVSFMRIWDATCATVLSTGARRGAMMATLRCDHPDIIEFVTAKRERGALRNFNLSVLVTDAFLDAVTNDRDWSLVFPCTGDRPDPAVQRTIRARGLWDLITREAYEHAEPGILFIDRINRTNNLYYCEEISATNPCGEVPLPPHGACNLGSINLTRFVADPFTADARLDVQGIADTASVAVRLLDNVIDVSGFPLPEQAVVERERRRVGIGITGLADTLIMLGLHYDSDSARELVAGVMRAIRDAAFRASIALAREKGAFPCLDTGKYLQSPFIRSLPDDLQEGIAENGIRNSHLLAVAPTGTISLLANTVSSGIEPVYAFRYRRRVLDRDGRRTRSDIVDPALRLYRQRYGEGDLPSTFVTAHELSPKAHLAMQAAVQPYVDSAISKTINIPVDYPFERFQDVFMQAQALGLKGCTVFRPNVITGAVLEAEGTHCTDPERECD